MARSAPSYLPGYPTISPNYTYTTLYITPSGYPLLHFDQESSNRWRALLDNLEDLANFLISLKLNPSDFGEFVGYDRAQLTYILLRARELYVRPMTYVLFNSLLLFKYPQQFMRAYNFFIQNYCPYLYPTYKHFLQTKSYPDFFYLENFRSLVKSIEHFPYYGV